MVAALNDGSAAFIAASSAIIPKWQTQVSFSDGYMEVAQQIITHRKNARIKKIEDLSGKTIDVRKGTAYQQRWRSGCMMICPQKNSSRKWRMEKSISRLPTATSF
jgi:ABC-type amino acid transport substrate-binding protein